jgi:hypothetical protein
MLPKLDAKLANYENPLDRWAMFLKGWDNMELLERLSEEDPAIAQARKALEKWPLILEPKKSMNRG